jgi:putative copper resistance protein D
MDNFLFFPRAIDAAIADAAFAITFGLVIVDFWVERDCAPQLRDTLRRGILLCAVAMFFAFVAQTYLSTATMIGSSAFAAVHDQFKMVMTETHAGRVLLCSCIITLVLVVLIAVQRAWRTRAKTWTLLAVLIALAATRAATGHPAADGDFTLAEGVQLIHLLSIATWAGGVITASFVILPSLLRDQQNEAIVTFMQRLSRTVTIALVLVVLTGIYNSYRGLGGTLAPLVHSQWGGALDLKSVLVGVAFALGATCRGMLRRNRSLSSTQASRLGLVLRSEAIVMLLILLVSALLANSAPPDAM